MKSLKKIRKRIIEKLLSVDNEDFLSDLEKIVDAGLTDSCIVKSVLTEVNEPHTEYSSQKDIVIENKENQIILKINKNQIDKEVILNLIKRLQLEIIVKKSGFNKDFLKIAEEIKENWWNENKEDFLKEVNR